MSEAWMKNLKTGRYQRKPVAQQIEESEADLVSHCKVIATQMNVYMEVAGQRKAKGSGSTVGLPDAFIYVAGWCHPVEFKTESGKLSQAQANCMVQRLVQQVDTFVIRDTDSFIELINRSRKQPLSRQRQGIFKGIG